MLVTSNRAVSEWGRVFGDGTSEGMSRCATFAGQMSTPASKKPRSFHCRPALGGNDDLDGLVSMKPVVPSMAYEGRIP